MTNEEQEVERVIEQLRRQIRRARTKKDRDYLAWLLDTKLQERDRIRGVVVRR